MIKIYDDRKTVSQINQLLLTPTVHSLVAPSRCYNVAPPLPPPPHATKWIAIISMSKSNAASASHRNRCWRAKSYHWQPPVSGAIAADRGSLASAYNCFAESRQDPLVPTVAQASLDDCTAPVVQGALLQNSCMQRQAHRDRRRWRLTPAVASDRFSRATSDSDAMHFAMLQPFFSDCLYTPFFF